MQRSDEQVYSRFLAERREEDLELLLRRYRESLTLFLFGIVRNWEDAEELMLDAFAEAAAARTGFSGRSSFKTWLFAIGRHLALRRLRKQHRRTLPLEEQEGGEASSPEPELMRAERDKLLYEALERLHPDYRQVLYLVYFEGMDTEAVARVMGKRKKQIYNLNERGRKALRDELDRMGFEYAQYR